MKGELYEYNGQMLSQAEIARLEGINRQTLADWYKKTGDMILVVAGAKKSLAQRNIDYNGEVLSLKAISEKEYLEVKEAFYITDREEKFLKSKKVIIDQITRQLLLYEFSNIIEEWPTNELLEMMELYDISDEEKMCIVLDLYAPFKNLVIDPTEQYKERNNLIRSIITDSTIDNDTILSNVNISEQEKQEILKKRNILSKIILQKTRSENNSLK